MADTKCQNRSVEAGFTLFEVVVAMALLALILAASFGLLGLGLRSMRASHGYTAAVLLAKQKLYQASLTKPEPGIADQGSDGPLRWSTEIIPQDLGSGDLPARLFQLRVRVAWGAPARENVIEMVTLSSSIDEEKLRATTMPAAESRNLPSASSSRGLFPPGGSRP